MRHFCAVSLKKASEKAGNFKRVVGRVTLPPFEASQGIAQCMYSPGSQKPCVYWRVIVQEEWIRIKHCKDKDGHHHTERTRHWEIIVDKENYVDFYLQDGDLKLFVNGSKGNQCKVQSTWDEGGSNSWCSFSHNTLPPSIKWMVHKHATGFSGWNRSWHGHQCETSGPTGSFRYSECIFAVNEKISALGMVSEAIPDPYTQTATMCLIPANKQTMSKDAMDDWSKWDEWSWEDLTEVNNAVLLADSKEFTKGVNVEKHSDLPRWQQAYVPEYAAWNMPESQWGAQAPVHAPDPAMNAPTAPQMGTHKHTQA